MGEQHVDRIIQQWRAEARAAGESAPTPAAVFALRSAVRRVGWLRILAAVGALCIFSVVAAQVLVSGGEPVVAQPSANAGDGGAASGPVPVSGGQATPQERSPDWFELLQAVDAARGRAYSSADPARLLGVFTADGPALARERAVVAALVAAESRAVGWRTDLLAVRVVATTDDTARLGVADQRGSYELLRADGAATQVPAAGRGDWTISLKREEGRWLVDDVVAQDAATSRTGPP